MPSALVQVADAVTAAIAGHDFGIKFECERSYPNWDLKLEEAGCLRVDVVPVRHISSTPAGRGGPDVNPINYRCAVDIGVRKKFGFSDQRATDGRTVIAEIDRLVELVEQIHGFISAWQQRNILSNIKWGETDIRASYVGDHLKDWPQFTGLIGLTFTAKVDVDTSNW